ncbi:calcium-binding protein [Streptomyces sp. 4N509B]|uniref:calcium-binding protein n=1 Tax=Streptomyces sp. 4N509B TaxID=3457413 RepID=UPI003FD5F78A
MQQPRQPRLVTTLSVTTLALLASGLATASASAQEAPATVSADWDSQSIAYLAADGQVNDLYVMSMGSVTEGSRRIGFNDEVPIQAGENCLYLDPSDDTFVVCELPTTSALPDDVQISLGDGDDYIFTSDPGVSVVDGGDGSDEMHAHSAKTIIGGAGDDMLMGGLVMLGGDGMDHLMGDDRDQELRGGRGMDHVEAFGGADVVYGNSGEDHVTGGRGDDVISGGPDNDTLYGNSGNDTIRGGGGDDTLSGGPDTDDVLQ